MIAIELEETRPGQMRGTARLDPNICSLDLWGDLQGCTRMAVQQRELEATMMRTLDPRGHRRVHWRLSVDGMPEAKVSLIEHPRAHLWYLTVQVENEGTSVVPLFDARLFAHDAMGRGAAELPGGGHPRTPETR